jgi:hypothetical protein
MFIFYYIFTILFFYVFTEFISFNRIININKLIKNNELRPNFRIISNKEETDIKFNQILNFLNNNNYQILNYTQNPFNVVFVKNSFTEKNARVYQFVNQNNNKKLSLFKYNNNFNFFHAIWFSHKRNDENIDSFKQHDLISQ